MHDFPWNLTVYEPRSISGFRIFAWWITFSMVAEDPCFGSKRQRSDASPSFQCLITSWYHHCHDFSSWNLIMRPLEARSAWIRHTIDLPESSHQADPPVGGNLTPVDFGADEEQISLFQWGNSQGLQAWEVFLNLPGVTNDNLEKLVPRDLLSQDCSIKWCCSRVRFRNVFVFSIR